MAQESTSLIYVGDPMCSWCYGISNELEGLWEDNKAIEREVVLGGLRPGGGEEWNTSFKDFLRHHWEDVSKASGVEFSYRLLEQDAFDYDTEPACRAVVIAREMKEEVAMSFFKQTQRKFYYENKDPKEVLFYKEICLANGLDYEVFAKRFLAVGAKTSSAQDFGRARQLGVNSFPTILLKHNGKSQIIAKGFSTKAEMQKRINAILGA